MPIPEMVPVFANTTLNLHPDTFVLVSLPLSEKEKALELFKSIDPFSTVSVDHAEVSLILRDSDWVGMKGNFSEYEEEGPYSAITFDIVLDLNLIGYLSVVTAVLAEEQISVYAVSTFLRDHILVKAVDAKKAMGALEALIKRCKIPNNG